MHTDTNTAEAMIEIRLIDSTEDAATVPWDRLTASDFLEVNRDDEAVRDGMRALLAGETKLVELGGGAAPVAQFRLAVRR